MCVCVCMMMVKKNEIQKSGGKNGVKRECASLCEKEKWSARKESEGEGTEKWSISRFLGTAFSGLFIFVVLTDTHSHGEHEQTNGVACLTPTLTT